MAAWQCASWPMVVWSPFSFQVPNLSRWHLSELSLDDPRHISVPHKELPKVQEHQHPCTTVWAPLEEGKVTGRRCFSRLNHSFKLKPSCFVTPALRRLLKFVTAKRQKFTPACQHGYCIVVFNPFTPSLFRITSCQPGQQARQHGTPQRSALRLPA